MHSTPENIEIGRRLALELDKLFKTRREAAEAMGMAETNLSQMISGKLPFGKKNRVRFEKAGVNVFYVMTGVIPDRRLQIESINEEMLTRECMQYLKSQGVKSVEELKKVFEVYKMFRIAADKIEPTPTKKKSIG